MRSLLLVSLTVVLGACARSAGTTTVVDAGSLGAGPDAIVIRIARNGGAVRAYRYPRLDSLLWKSNAAAPPVLSFLAFDQESGALAYLDRRGVPGWIDLRVGSVSPATRTVLRDVASNDARAIYGVRQDSTVQRLTPNGDWSVGARGRVQSIFPLPDGTLVLIVERRSGPRLVRLHPPEATLTDSAALAIPLPDHVAVSPLGDRIFLGADRNVLAVGGQSLARAARLRMRGVVRAMTTTPSGDRLYVATENSRDVDVIDRFANERVAAIRLPGAVSDLRMDPLGRYLLVRQITGDSMWVVGIGDGRVLDHIQSEWRSDLPSVAVDGAIATVRGPDVVFVTPGVAQPRMIVKDGGNEIWQFIFWNGFRPRAKGLDQPVVFPDDSLTQPAFAADSSAPPRPARVDTPLVKTPPARVDTALRSVPKPDGWIVSFAAVLSEERARELAGQIKVDGQQARVVVSTNEGIRVSRVVLGPYPTREDADRVGKTSGHAYWVFSGPP